MVPRPRVLVIQHADSCPVGMVEPWLRRAGLDCDILAGHQGRAVPVGLGGYAALVVLGGAMGAESDSKNWWLGSTRALIAATIASGAPYLGVCLGHQLAAVATGGVVGPNPNGPTHALLPFAPNRAGRADPLTSALPSGAPVLHWNSDTVLELPPGVTTLATCPDGTIQAARYGVRAWGVQFHPEVDPATVASWDPGEDAEADALLLADFERRRGALHRDWEKLIKRFAKIARAWVA